MPNDDQQYSRRNPPRLPVSLTRADRQLIEELLNDAPRRPQRRAAAPRLRTTDDRRRSALDGFLLRNWLDRTLLIAETVLLLALIAAASYWFADTYVRDRLYEWQRAQGSTVAATEPTASAAPEEANDTALALPYTLPENEQPAADFLAEQPLQIRQVAGDPRPQRIVVPAIALDSAVIEVFVVDGIWQVAEYAAGFHHGSALPGIDGNTVLAGHAGMRGAVFKDLPRLQIGDEIRLETGDWIYTYRVRETREVWPTQVEVMEPTPEPLLTLITCTNWDTQRLIVVAELIASRPRS